MIGQFKPSAYTPEILIPVAETEKFAVMEKLTSHCSFKDGIINTIDGLRVEYPLGWGPNKSVKHLSKPNYAL
jgi:phosphomannomutase/phosphoglucomutase